MSTRNKQNSVEPVLPGHEQACPPFQQKYTAIWQKLTANSYLKKFRSCSAISCHFPHINF
jgi:hypothetical protein